MSQNLIATAYVIDETLESDGRRIYVDLGALDGDGIPPQAVGRTLFLSELLPIHNHRAFPLTRCWRLIIFGKHIALCHCPYIFDHEWWLQIWDWQQSTTSSVSPSRNSLKDLTVDTQFSASSSTHRQTAVSISVYLEATNC